LKKYALIVTLIAVLISPAIKAQFTAQLSPAETIYLGVMQGLGYIGLYDDGLGVVGGVRYGIGGYADASLKLGVLDFDGYGDDTGFLLTGDMRYQVMEMRINDPFDLSVGGLFETVLGVGVGNFSLGGLVHGSRTIKLENGKLLWPYGRLVLRWDHVESNDDFNIGFIAGTSYELSPSTMISAEFQFDDLFGFAVGMNFGL